MSTSTQLWEQLVTTALVGTERQAWSTSVAGDALGGLLARLDGADAEGALLSAAAALGTYRHAGWQPAVDERPVPVPCPPEALPRCPPRAAQRLSALLAEERREFLPEWLRTAASAGVRVPEAALPDLLELARARPDVWELLAPVAGERGRWLAALNPEWAALVAGESIDEDAWETGSRAERLALLQRWRATDPERAREQVAATWVGDPPEERARFLATFHVGLTMADEPFLEEALDDRRKEVRQAAVELLSRLPESRLCGRMLERLAPLMTFREQGGTDQLVVHLPEACDKGMVRDGVDPHLRRERLGEKAGWLMQMLAAVPPTTWSNGWGRSPRALIALSAGEWQLALMAGWSQAAIRYTDEEWAGALLPSWLTLAGGALFRDLWWELFGVLSTDRWEAVVMELLRAETFGMRAEHAALLHGTSRSWSPLLARHVTAALQRHITGGNHEADYAVRELLKQAVHRIPLEYVPDTVAAWATPAEGWGVWEEAVAAFVERLQFRHTMIKEFA